MNKDQQWLLEEKYAGIPSPQYEADLKRLNRGEPLAYIIGWSDFLDCRIDLSLRPLIPRPETEWWVEQVINKTETTKPLKILDLFAGSGCIGIALLKHLPNAVVDFGEKEQTLKEQIEKNIFENKIDPKRARIITTDVFSNIPDPYDIIVANPPYIDPETPETVDRSVLDWEPHAALFAEKGGLFFIEALLQQASGHLNADGVLYVEFAKDQEEDIAQLMKETKLEGTIHADQYGVPRWFSATKKPS
jgi:release factor glutamine methyltransferase